jgi:hypothetical protein
MTPSEDEDDRFIATHEAGHAVGAILSGITFHLVKVGAVRDPDGREGLGGCAIDRPAEERIARGGPRLVWPYVVTNFCGASAERLVRDDERAIRRGSISDRRWARRMAAQACRSSVAAEWAGAHRALIRAAREEASRLIAVPAHAELVHAVAAELLAGRTLSGGDVADMADERLRPSRRSRLTLPQAPSGNIP